MAFGLMLCPPLFTPTCHYRVRKLPLQYSIDLGYGFCDSHSANASRALSAELTVGSDKY